MAQVAPTLNDEAANLAASGKSPKSILTGKMMCATSGASYNAPLTGGKVVGDVTFQYGRMVQDLIAVRTWKFTGTGNRVRLALHKK